MVNYLGVRPTHEPQHGELHQAIPGLADHFPGPNIDHGPIGGFERRAPSRSPAFICLPHETSPWISSCLGADFLHLHLSKKKCAQRNSARFNQKRAKFQELREASLAGLKKVRGVYSLDMNLSSCSKTTIGKDTCA